MAGPRPHGRNRGFQKRPPVNKETIKRFVKYVLKYYKVHLFVVTVCIITAAISSNVASIFLRKLIDECITPGISKGYDAVMPVFMNTIRIMIAVYLVGIICSFTYTRIMATVSQGTLKHLRDDMFEKMQTLPIKYFDTHQHGDIMSTYTNDVDTIRQMVGMTLPSLINSALSIGITVSIMVSYSVWMFLMVIVFLYLMMLLTKTVAGKSADFMQKQQKSLAKEEGFVEEMIQGQKVVKVFNHEEVNRKQFDRLNDQLFEDGYNANRLGNILMPVLNNLGNLMYVILAIAGGIMVYYSVPNLTITGMSVMTIGIVVSFLTMVRGMSQTIGQFSMQITVIAMAFAGLQRVFAIIDEEPEEDNGYVTLVKVRKNRKGEYEETEKNTGMWAWKHPHRALGTTTYERLMGEIELVDVDFGYTPEKQVLYDISLKAKPGEQYAFVGATGAGKTTITNLINRFYDIPDGKIRFDGININKIKKADLRKSLGMVLQDVNLFTGTVMDNIRYGRLEATDAECKAAAKLSNAHGFIRRLPEGYNTMLTNNGSNLSQGQRQLISIARAAVADPPAMILDEATSSIDTRTESLVSQGMDNLMIGRTVFVIAHRLSTVRNSDDIIVLDHGRIIEHGNHMELIRNKGTYYQLYTGAFELE